jgi:molybdate transport system substrate-binding protein
MKIFSALAVREVVEPASKTFTTETGEPVESFFGPVGTLQGKIEAGESADLAILIPPTLEKLAKAGVLAGRFDLGRVGIAVAIKEGAKSPDFSTPQAFRQMLLDARSIALTDPGVGGTAGIYLAGLLERLGIAEAIRSKVKWQKNGFFSAQAVANGEAELGMTQKSEIVAIKGVAIAGPLPEPLQSVTTYCAGIFTASKAQDKACAFIEKLQSPALHAQWKHAGFDLPGAT